MQASYHKNTRIFFNKKHILKQHPFVRTFKFYNVNKVCLTLKIIFNAYMVASFKNKRVHGTIVL